MTAELAISRIERGEDSRTAFLADASPKKIGQTICALLNTEGGIIFCGVKADGDVMGLPRTSKKSAQTLELKLKAAITPNAVFNVSLEDVEGKQVLVIETAEGSDRPYVYEGAVWVRKDIDTHPADARALRAFISTQSDAAPRWERRISPAMTLEDLDRREVREMANAARDEGRFPFENPDDDLASMRELSLWSNEGFTQGGDILFGKTSSRRHPQCRVQWIEFTDGKVGDDYANQNWMQGPMVQVCRELFGKLDGLNKVRAHFPEGAVARSDHPMYASRALREGIVNALVHRDYSAYSGGVKVSVYPDRIEIWNSGRLPNGLKTSDLKKDHPSILINPDITQAFYVAGLMEAIGRGTQKIVVDCKRLGAPTPMWKDAPAGVTLTIFAAGMAVRDEAPAEFNSRQRALLAELAVGDAITLAQYRLRYEVSERQSRRDLLDLVDAEELRREGKGPSTIYRRVPPKNRP